MPSFYTLPTAPGEAKIANAIALGTQVNISELAVGDGGGSLPTPDSDRTTLVNELRRAPINRIEVDDENPNWIVVEQILPPDVGGWTVRELGLLDDDGNLIAYGNYPETYKPVLSEGSGRTQTIRFVMQVSDTAAVTLKVDPSVVLATRQYVDDADQAHAESRNHPAATESAQGMIQRATSAQALAGSDNNRAMTPARVHESFNQFGFGAALKFNDAGIVDDIDKTKFFYVGASNGGNVMGVACTVSGLHIEDDSGQRAQQIFVRAEDGGNDHLSYRRRLNGTWGGQVRIFAASNVASIDEAADGVIDDKPMTPLKVKRVLENHKDDQGAHLDSKISLSQQLPQSPSAENVAEALAEIGDLAAESYQNRVIYDASGTSVWNVPELLKKGIRKAQITVIGGGGGGRSSLYYCGGGGGGGIARGMVDLTDVDTVSVTVGAGGAGDTNGSGKDNGGTSSFGPYMSATGGQAGMSFGTGGKGGEGSGGDFNGSTGAGSFGVRFETDGSTGVKGYGGVGGGWGGVGGTSLSDTSVTGHGQSGHWPGGGGGGGDGTSSKNGGNGAPGGVIIEW
ncbi:MAG: hypothetical protein GYB17_14965 [Gammaproteobacteria bacterium]|nr:hypothetical protein [Gammaproteobacteria bacterium]